MPAAFDMPGDEDAADPVSAAEWFAEKCFDNCDTSYGEELVVVEFDEEAAAAAAAAGAPVVSLCSLLFLLGLPDGSTPSLTHSQTVVLPPKQTPQQARSP